MGAGMWTGIDGLSAGSSLVIFSSETLSSAKIILPRIVMLEALLSNLLEAHETRS